MLVVVEHFVVDLRYFVELVELVELELELDQQRLVVEHFWYYCYHYYPIMNNDKLDNFVVFLTNSLNI